MSTHVYRDRVTLKDIADKTGYTINTVSRALNDKRDISQETREKIQKIARDMGYIRNNLASALRSGSTKTLALIIGAMNNPFYAILADEIQKEAFLKGYTLIILCSRDDEEIERQAAETAVGRLVDGILFMPGCNYQKTEQFIHDAGVPCVLLNRYIGETFSDTAVCDDEQGGYLAAKHLLEAGHKKIGMLSNRDVPFSFSQRKEGFFRACREAGLDEEDNPVCLASDPDLLLTQLKKWHEQGVTGIFSFCDVEAWNIIDLLQNAGIRVPEDMGVVGFDNIQKWYHFPSSICSVEFDCQLMAEDVVGLLLDRIHHRKLEKQSRVYPTRIVCHGTCGCHCQQNAAQKQKMN